MGIIVSKEHDENTRLNERIAADLRERAQSAEKTSDFADDSEYVKDLKQTGKHTWIWVVLVVLALAILAALALF